MHHVGDVVRGGERGPPGHRRRRFRREWCDLDSRRIGWRVHDRRSACRRFCDGPLFSSTSRDEQHQGNEQAHHPQILADDEGRRD